MQKASETSTTNRRSFLSVAAGIAATCIAMLTRSSVLPAAPATDRNPVRQIPKARLEDFAHRLLDTDAAIIEANDTHIVLAIRIARSTLAKNHHLLADLSDAATGDALI